MERTGRNHRPIECGVRRHFGRCGTQENATRPVPSISVRWLTLARIQSEDLSAGLKAYFFDIVTRFPASLNSIVSMKV